MRLGLFPGQLEALRELARKGVEAEKRSRRQFFVALAATIGVGAGAFFVGRAVGRAEGRAGAELPPGDARARWRNKLAWAEEFATQPIEVLLERRSTFLMTIEQTGGSDITWRGFSRLAQHALQTPEPNRDLLVRMSEVVRVAPPPASITPVVERILEALAR